MTKPTIDPAAVKRLNEAAEWFFYLKAAQPTEAELAEWTASCELWRDPYFREAYTEQMAMLEGEEREGDERILRVGFAFGVYVPKFRGRCAL